MFSDGESTCSGAPAYQTRPTRCHHQQMSKANEGKGPRAAAATFLEGMEAICIAGNGRPPAETSQNRTMIAARCELDDKFVLP